jgi:hypothetical protein
VGKRQKFEFLTAVSRSPSIYEIHGQGRLHNVFGFLFMALGEKPALSVVSMKKLKWI